MGESRESVPLKSPQVILMSQFVDPVCDFSGYQMKEFGGPGGLC